MALQFSTACRDALLTALATTLGGSETMQVLGGTEPASCAVGSAAAATSATTSTSSATLNFSSTPGGIAGYYVYDLTTPTAVAPGTTVLSTTGTTAGMSADATGPGVGSGDAILFSANQALVTFSLASSGDWTAASGGQIMLAGLTLAATAGATGTAAYFRMYDSSGNCHVQGTCGTSAADLVFNNTSIAATQMVDITGFTLTAPGA
jgi:hypothetical protein